MEINKRNTRTWSMLGARGTFGTAVFNLASEREDFMVLSADLGVSSGLGRFMDHYSERFVNVGIAEQNLIGIAAGIAREGIPVFATSFAPFITMRSCEQIRMDMGYMNLNVKAVGLGSGLSMAYLGNSHYGLEDIAIMRSIPNITIVSPADGAEIYKTVFAAAEWEGPIYIRLTGAAGNPIVYSEDYDFEIGKGIVLKEGNDIAIFSVGTMVYESLQAAKIIEEKGISVKVINMHTIKPLDKELIDKILEKVKMVVSVEEHTLIGGLGSAISDYRTYVNSKVPQLMIGLKDQFGKTGSYEYLLEMYGLKGNSIANDIFNFYNRNVIENNQIN